MNLDEKLPDIAVNFHEGLPSEGFFNKLESRSLVIIDDLYEQDNLSSKMENPRKKELL